MNARPFAVHPVAQTEVAPHLAVRLDLEQTVGADPPQPAVANQHMAERSRFAEDLAPGCLPREPEVDEHDPEQHHAGGLSRRDGPGAGTPQEDSARVASVVRDAIQDIDVDRGPMVGLQGHRHVIFVIQESPLRLWNGRPRYNHGFRRPPAEQTVQVADVVRLRNHLFHGGGLYPQSP